MRALHPLLFWLIVETIRYLFWLIVETIRYLFWLIVETIRYLGRLCHAYPTTAPG